MNDIHIAQLINQHIPTSRSTGRRHEIVSGTKSHVDGTNLDAPYPVADNDKYINTSINK